jgi:hypothetical protein
MSYVIVSVNPDGTAAVTTPIPDDREAADAYAAEHGGEVVSRATVDALYASARPVEPAGGIPVAEFKRRAAMLYYVLGTKPDDVQRRWDRVLGLLDSFTVVYPAEQPVAGLLQAAVADGLLTAEQAAALVAD